MNVRDPVCGREIDLGDAMASEDHDGWAYFFCSAGCHEAFKSSPDRYSQKPEAARRAK
jgi:YHS domain-containing protein